MIIDSMLIKILDSSVHIWTGLRDESQTNSGAVSKCNRIFVPTPKRSAPFAASCSPDIGGFFPETQHTHSSLVFILGGVELHFLSFKPLWCFVVHRDISWLLIQTTTTSRTVPDLHHNISCYIRFRLLRLHTSRR